ncbi:MAG: diacylglycerol kinase family lipid kinase [Elusimicrobiaceae bacterium]|nr:diacylglycerol kinase family lipid kinase [Elusimicrobiaceae bacterium]
MKIRFIVNPISGNRPIDTKHLNRCIQNAFPGAEICLTQSPGHATILAQEAVDQQFYAVVAIGGDGTINETARALVGTSTVLGVIPKGSGNGFAREIGMMHPLEEALPMLQRARVLPCDVGMANGELFLNLAGVGIEAAIAWQFKDYGKRGKLPYFLIGAKTVFSYCPPVLDVTFNGQQKKCQPLTLVFANGKQYGSNFKIAPQANLQDGLLDMVTVQNAPKWKLALATPYFFTDHQKPFHITDTTQVKQAVILHNGEILYHIDGEPRKTQNRLEISLRPKALRVWVPCL